MFGVKTTSKQSKSNRTAGPSQVESEAFDFMDSFIADGGLSDAQSPADAIKRFNESTGSDFSSLPEPIRRSFLQRMHEGKGPQTRRGRSRVDPKCIDPNPSPQAVAQMKSCVRQKSHGPLTGGSLLDTSSGTPRLFILDASGKAIRCTNVALGENSYRNGKIVAGHRSGSHMTPAGLFQLTTHRGTKYGPTNSIGMKGLGRMNRNTQTRGVIIHATRGGSTWGCIGIPDEEFNRSGGFKDVLMGMKGQYHFNFFPGRGCGGEKVSSQSFKVNSAPPAVR